MNYWLFKSEPDTYSIDELAAEKEGVGVWDGIRNYQARNLLRDKVTKGDEVFFYHSSCKQLGIAGVATVVSKAYPDPSQYDVSSAYFDARATEQSPRWFCVDLQFKQKFSPIISLQQLKAVPELAAMSLFQQARLSIHPVTNKEWEIINKHV